MKPLTAPAMAAMAVVVSYMGYVAAQSTFAPTFAPTFWPDTWALQYFKTVTTYQSSSSCMGPYASQQVFTSGDCLPSAEPGGGGIKRNWILSPTGSYVKQVVQSFSDPACTVLSTTTAAISQDSGLVGGGKCTAAASGPGSTSTVYSQSMYRFADHGVVWTGYSSAAACTALQQPVFFSLTVANACVPRGSNRWAKLSCGAGSLHTEEYPSPSCSAASRLSVLDAPFNSSALSCAKANPAPVDTVSGAVDVNTDLFMSPSCSFSRDVDAGPEKMAKETAVNSFFFHTFHVGSKCASLPSVYHVEEAPINSCLASLPADAAGTGTLQYTCKEGDKKVTVTRARYAPSDLTCSSAPTDSTNIYHNFVCDRVDADMARGAADEAGLYVKSQCGALPSSVVSEKQLIVKQYSDARCSLGGVTRSVLLGRCMPLYGPKRHGLPAVIEARERLIAVSSSSPAAAAGNQGGPAAPPLRLQQLRYKADDVHCANTPTSSSIVQFVDGACQTDPLGALSGQPVFIARAAIVQDLLSPSSFPWWFALPLTRAPRASCYQGITGLGLGPVIAPSQGGSFDDRRCASFCFACQAGDESGCVEGQKYTKYTVVSTLVATSMAAAPSVYVNLKTCNTANCNQPSDAGLCSPPYSPISGYFVQSLYQPTNTDCAGQPSYLMIEFWGPCLQSTQGQALLQTSTKSDVSDGMVRRVSGFNSPNCDPSTFAGQITETLRSRAGNNKEAGQCGPKADIDGAMNVAWSSASSPPSPLPFGKTRMYYTNQDDCQRGTNPSARDVLPLDYSCQAKSGEGGGTGSEKYVCSNSNGVSLLQFTSPDCSGTGTPASIPDPLGVFTFSSTCQVTQGAGAGDAIHFYGKDQCTFPPPPP